MSLSSLKKSMWAMVDSLSLILSISRRMLSLVRRWCRTRLAWLGLMPV
jgi:hypothetical protein